MGEKTDRQSEEFNVETTAQKTLNSVSAEMMNGKEVEHPISSGLLN